MTDFERALMRIREVGYTVRKAVGAAMSAEGHLLRYTVGAGLASEDDVIRIANGLDHLSNGKGFVVGQAVQLVEPMWQPVNIPAGAVLTVAEVSSTSVTLRKGDKLVQLDPSAIRIFPLPDAMKRRTRMLS